MTDWTHTFSLRQFDPALGTLDSVYLEATFNITASGTVFNTSSSTANFSVRKLPRLSSLALPGSLGTMPASVTIPVRNYSLPGFGSASYGPFTAQVTVDRTFTGADMASFVGTGFDDLIGSTLTWQTISSQSGSPGASLTTIAGATVSVEYMDTAAVPRPFHGRFDPGRAGLFARPPHGRMYPATLAPERRVPALRDRCSRPFAGFLSRRAGMPAATGHCDVQKALAIPPKSFNLRHIQHILDGRSN